MNLTQILKGVTVGASLATLASCMPKQQTITPHHGQLRGGKTNINGYEIIVKERHLSGRCHERTSIIFQESTPAKHVEPNIGEHKLIYDKGCDWYKTKGPVADRWETLAKQAYNEICNGLCPLIKDYEGDKK